MGIMKVCQVCGRRFPKSDRSNHCAAHRRRGSGWDRWRRNQRVWAAYGYRCGWCRAAGPLQVHHLDGNPANDADANLVPLCADCHREAHF
jgi:hypothetical protein